MVSVVRDRRQIFGTVINDGEELGPPKMEMVKYEGGERQTPNSTPQAPRWPEAAAAPARTSRISSEEMAEPMGQLTILT